MDEQEHERIVELLEAIERGEQPTGEALGEFQPYDLAQVIEEVVPLKPRVQLLQSIVPSLAAETLEHLDPDLQFDLLQAMTPDAARLILTAMGSDALADLVGALHPKAAQDVLRRIPEADQANIRVLLTYPETSAGGRMTLDFIAVRQRWTAEQVIAHFRRVGHEVEIAHYVYVVDRDRKLVGVTSMRNVILADPTTQVSEFMGTNPVSVPAAADQEEAARLLQDYDFGAIPVVDDQGRLAGVLSVDDVLDVLEEEATEDIQRLGGSEPLDQPYLSASLFDLFRKRIGWLLILFVAASLTQNILQAYSGFLNEVVALTFFIPLLIGTGGNAGSQASTLVIRAMAIGEVTFSDVFRVVWREARLGILLGAAMALVTFLRTYIFGGDLALGLTVAATIATIVLVTSTLGAGLPLVGRKLGFDPAVFSAPVITTVADAAGLLIYFQFARVLLGLG